MKKIFFAIVAVAMISCKNEKTETPQAAQVETPTEDFFKVTLDVVAKKDDNFHVFYTEDKSLNFSEENSVWVAVKGSEASQKVVFNLPKDKIPTHLRIDFGLKEDQGEIRINGMEMSYFGKTSTIPGAEFFKYFRPNESSTAVDVQAQTVKAIIKPGQPFAGPSVYPNEPLEKEVERITAQ